MSDGEKGEKHQTPRVRFEHERPAQMMAIDGTWQRACTIDDISDGGAKLTVGDSIQGLPITEFFLVLSPFGLAYRHCRLVWGQWRPGRPVVFQPRPRGEEGRGKKGADLNPRLRFQSIGLSAQ